MKVRVHGFFSVVVTDLCWQVWCGRIFLSNVTLNSEKPFCLLCGVFPFSFSSFSSKVRTGVWVVWLNLCRNSVLDTSSQKVCDFLDEPALVRTIQTSPTLQNILFNVLLRCCRRRCGSLRPISLERAGRSRRWHRPEQVWHRRGKFRNEKDVLSLAKRSDLPQASDLVFELNVLRGQFLSTHDVLFQVSQEDRDCYLISDDCQRTMKYFHCLAFPVPCVSHVWIKDCCVLVRFSVFLNGLIYFLSYSSAFVLLRVLERQSVLCHVPDALSFVGKASWSQIVHAASGFRYWTWKDSWMVSAVWTFSSVWIFNGFWSPEFFFFFF